MPPKPETQPEEKKVAAASSRRYSSGALPLLLVAAALVCAGAGASWYERSIENRARELAEEIAGSVVPDEALVPSAVKGARQQNADLAAALDVRFAPRAEPVAALRAIEAEARAAGVISTFSKVEVTGWDGNPARFGDPGTAAAAAPYVGIVAAVDAAGSWPKVLSFAAALERLPLASRVDVLRLSSSLGEKGVTVWTLAAEVTVAGK